MIAMEFPPQNVEEVPYLKESQKRMAMFLNRASDAIDSKFGGGFSKANPVLLSACIQAQSFESVSHEIGCSLNFLANEIACHGFPPEEMEEEDESR